LSKKSFGIVAVAIIGFLIYLPLTHLSIQLTIGREYFAGEKFFANPYFVRFYFDY